MMIIVLDDYRQPPRQFQWHVGDKFPELDGRTVTIEADGHELRWLQIAIANGRAAANADYRHTVHGVIP